MTAAPPTSALHRLGPVLRGLLVALAAAAGAVFLWVALRRIGYPFELEWLEGDLFHHALRIRDGLAWYPRPSLEFFPNVYPPGYPALCALAMRAFGPSLAVMRAVSLASTVAAAALVAAIVRREAGGARAGVIGAGLFLAAFGVCGAWYDLARVDMLALALALLGVHLAHRRASAAGVIAGAAALALATLAKQSHLALLAGTLAAWLAWGRGRALVAAAVAAALLAGAVVALQASGGWFRFYAWDLPRAAPFVTARAWDFALRWLPRTFGLAVPAVALAYAGGARRSLPLLLAPVAVVVSISGWSLPGGYLNNAIPAAAFVAIAAGIGIGRLDTAPPRRAWLGPVAFACLVAQFAVLGYDPRPVVPTARDVREGMATVRIVQALPGPVLAPYFPYLLHLAGRPMHMQFHMLNELLQAKQAAPWLEDAGIEEDVRRRLAAREWGSLVGIESADGPIVTAVDRMARPAYVIVGPLVSADDRRTLYPLTGNRVRPGRVSIPAPAPAAAP